MNKTITFLLIFFFSTNCSLDNATGFWSKTEKLKATAIANRSDLTPLPSSFKKNSEIFNLQSLPEAMNASFNLFIEALTHQNGTIRNATLNASLANREITLSQFRGKHVLVNFWATWCGPCKIEMPSLEALYERFKDKNYALLAISNDMFGANIVKPFVKAHNINFPVLLDQRLKVSNAFGVVSLPTTFMIDPQGKIIGALFGAEDWATPSNILYFENLLK